MKKDRAKDRHAEAHADPRQRPLFEGWETAREPAESRARLVEEAADRDA